MSSAPAYKAVGFDTPRAGRQGRTEYEQMLPYDYPALFWLSCFVPSLSPSGQSHPIRVVDLGGHLGEKYRVFCARWKPLRQVSWIVIETHDAVAAAHDLSPADRPPGLSFTTDYSTLDGADILFASGVLQCLQEELWTLLDRLENPPTHCVINKVPLSHGPDVWTLQNGPAVVPYHVMNRERFLHELVSRGYSLLDEWPVPAISVKIPFQQAEGTTANAGLSLPRASRM